MNENQTVKQVLYQGLLFTPVKLQRSSGALKKVQIFFIPPTGQLA